MRSVDQDLDEWNTLNKEGFLWCYFREEVQKDGKGDGVLVGTKKRHTGEPYHVMEKNP